MSRPILGCTRPKAVPCPKPERMRFSTKAPGGGARLTAGRCLGYPPPWVKCGLLPEYWMLAGGLPLPHRKAEPAVEHLL